MSAMVCSAAFVGIDGYPIEVEVNAGGGDTLVVIVANKTPKHSSGWICAVLKVRITKP
jgi:hypothetical protein